MPFHMGHKYLLDTAQANCDHLTIVVCSLPTEPIPGRFRFNWVSAAYPDATVVHLSDPAMPQEPADHPDFWNIWKKTLLNYSPASACNFVPLSSRMCEAGRKCCTVVHAKPYDTFFSSEDYGIRLSEELGCHHFGLDTARIAVPISGTAIRKDPFGNWEYLTGPAKQFFNKTVLVTGPESCGKTTMSELLAKHYETVWAPEFAREYLAPIGFNFKHADLDNIADGQQLWMGEAKKFAEKVYFTDTCAVETHIYAQHYLGSSTQNIRAWLESQSWEIDLALLLTPEVKWVQDGLRNEEANRDKLFKQFEDLLIDYQIPYKVISSDDYAERFKACVGYVDDLLKGNSCVQS